MTWRTRDGSGSGGSAVINNGNGADGSARSRGRTGRRPNHVRRHGVEPTCAHNWQTLADLRRTMLVNNYSALPISDGQCGDRVWLCVEDEKLARYLRNGGRGRRTRTLGDERLKECEAGMDFLEAVAVAEDSQVKSVLSTSKLPVLATRPVAKNEKKREIVGIVTAFDLL